MEDHVNAEDAPRPRRGSVGGVVADARQQVAKVLDHDRQIKARLEDQLREVNARITRAAVELATFDQFLNTPEAQ